VFAGSHRKPEVVIMSVRQYEQLTETHERAVRVAAGSMDMEGMSVPEPVIEASRELAAGRIDFEEYRRRVNA
jgi:PHD/YefM family antitoxin component YafN of YafNO toxin-antitoxin module